MWVVARQGWNCYPRQTRCLQKEMWLAVEVALAICCRTLAVIYGTRLPFLLADLGTVIEEQLRRTRLVVVLIRSIPHVSRRRLRARSQDLDWRIQCTEYGVSEAHSIWQQYNIPRRV